jgi:multidrug resistance efflux pump
MSDFSPERGARRRHWVSLVWLLGGIVLAASMLGAGWMMRSQAGPPTGPASGALADAPALLHCIGHVDVPNGLSYPYPVRPGRVAEVKVVEGDEVKKGAVLFRMDDALARKDVAAAEALVTVAELDVQKVQNAEKEHAETVLGQEQAVEAARRAWGAARISYQRKRELVKQNHLAPEEADAAEKLMEQAEFALKGEEHKLALVKLEATDVAIKAKQAAADVTAKKVLRDKAQLVLDECTVTAPEDGMVLRLGVQAEDLLPPQPKSPAVVFCPARPRIVRAEVEQEWANRVQPGQVATIEDDTSSGNGPTWKGKVVRVGDWMAHRRSILPDPSQFLDVRTLECVVEIDSGQPPLRIGQRVRIALRNP